MTVRTIVVVRTSPALGGCRSPDPTSKQTKYYQVPQKNSKPLLLLFEVREAKGVDSSDCTRHDRQKNLGLF